MYSCGYLNKSQKVRKRDLLGTSVIKTSSLNAEGVGSVPGWGAKISHALGPKYQNINRSNIVTTSKKHLRMVHVF